MASFKIRGPRSFNGRVALPGDKSIAHRCVILGALAANSTAIKNFPFNEDCVSTIRAFKALGVKITSFPGKKTIKITGAGLTGLSRPSRPVFVGESGTTLRLLSGVLAGQEFKTRLTGAKSLSLRPMLRVTLPLRKMGAKISGRRGPGREEFLPLTIQGGKLAPITYRPPVASAQVKSAILLAGLYSEGATRVIEPVKSRDHTERLLKAFGADVKSGAKQVRIKGGREIFSPGPVYIPGDISSAAFFMVAAAITSGSRILLKNVSLNPSRLGVLRALRSMGAHIKVTKSQGRKVTKFEPMGDIEVKSSKLKGLVIKKSEIPSLIDELPVLMVAASCASGKSRFEGVGELRVKETDRIRSMLENLRQMGVDIQATRSEDVVIDPPAFLKGARVKSYGDHRTAMSMIVAGLAARGTTSLDETNCIAKSFPAFLKVLKSLTR